MPVVVIANPKGGVGKSTLSTNIAGYFASQGHTVLLGDADPQQSSALWLRLRPTQARAIGLWAVETDQPLRKPPKGASHVVLDTPAGLEGKALQEVLKIADKVVVPLQPSVFDIFATRAFLDTLAQSRRASKLQVGIVGMRLDERTIAADQLGQFVRTLDLPVLGYVRNTQNYLHLAAQGLTLFDLDGHKTDRDGALWQPITNWLDAP